VFQLELPRLIFLPSVAVAVAARVTVLAAAPVHLLKQLSQ
jgi:hypothetical protein